MRKTLPDFALDFQPTRPGLLPVVLFCAAALVAADALLDERTAHGHREAAEQAAAKAEKRRERGEAASRTPSVESLLSPEEAKAIAVAERAIRIDWERLFATIDHAVNDDVALLNFRPSVSARNLQMGGEARSMAAALAFVDALRQAPLAHVALMSHSVRSNEPGRPVAFEISAVWQPAASPN